MRYERAQTLFDRMATDMAQGLSEDECLRRLVARGFIAVYGDPDQLENTLESVDALVTLLEQEVQDHACH